MKREEHLKTLSWEHHHGLVAAFRLQQGLKNGTSKDVLRDYILFIWENDLEPHFWKEEQVIKSSLIETEEGTRIIEQMNNEHQAFRDLVRILTVKEHKRAHITTFADILNKHIRFEERKLFPFIQKESSPGKLAEIGIFLRKHYVPNCNEWQTPFWSDPGN